MKGKEDEGKGRWNREGPLEQCLEGRYPHFAVQFEPKSDLEPWCLASLIEIERCSNFHSLHVHSRDVQRLHIQRLLVQSPIVQKQLVQSLFEESLFV